MKSLLKSEEEFMRSIVRLRNLVLYVLLPPWTLAPAPDEEHLGEAPRLPEEMKEHLRQERGE